MPEVRTFYDEDLGKFIKYNWDGEGDISEQDKNALKLEARKFVSTQNNMPSPEQPDNIQQQMRAREFGEISKEPSIGEKIVTSPAIPMVTGIAGGILGAPGMVTGTGGAALGAGFGESVRQIGQQLYGSPNAPQTAGESAKEIGKTALYQGVLPELLGVAGSRAVRGLYPKVGEKYIQPLAKEFGEEVAPYVSKYLKKPVSQALTPAQVADKWTAAGRWESIVKSSFGGSGVMKTRYYAQEQGMKDYIKETVDGLFSRVERMPNVELGAKIGEAIKVGREAEKQINDRLEDAFMNLANKTVAPVQKTIQTSIVDASGKPMSITKTVMTKDVIDLNPVRNWAMEQKTGLQLGRSQAGEEFLDKLIKDIDTLGGNTSFDGLRTLRANLGYVINAHERTGDMTYGLANQVKKQLMEQAGVAAKTMGGDTLKAYKAFNGQLKNFYDTYETKFIQGLLSKAETDPSMVAGALIKNDRPELVVNAMKAIKNPTIKKQLEAGFVENLLRPDVEGVVAGKRLFNEMGRAGNELMNTLLTKETQHRLDVISTVLNATQKSTEAGGGSMLVQLMQGRAVGALIQAGALGAAGAGTYASGSPIPMIAGAGAILLTPRILAKLITHPTYGKMMIDGIKAGDMLTATQAQKIYYNLLSAGLKMASEDEKRTQYKQNMGRVPGQTIQGVK